MALAFAPAPTTRFIPRRSPIVDRRERMDHVRFSTRFVFAPDGLSVIDTTTGIHYPPRMDALPR